MNDIPLLHITDEAVSLARRLVEPGPLPRKAAGDALHLALSAIHGMDFLLTWNIRHLDNAEIKPKVQRSVIYSSFREDTIYRRKTESTEGIQSFHPAESAEHTLIIK